MGTFSLFLILLLILFAGLLLKLREDTIRYRPCEDWILTPLLLFGVFIMGAVAVVEYQSTYTPDTHIRYKLATTVIPVKPTEGDLWK